MRLRNVLIVLVAVAGCTAAPADAQSVLPIATAKRAITTYERLYWHGQPVTLTIGECRRRSAQQVTCVARASEGEASFTTVDWATRLRGGIIRVHPGEFLDVQ
jgi:hypothetical protein